MKIGTKEISDNCPECQSKIGWIRKPGTRLIKEGRPVYVTVQYQCLKCDHTTPKYKIKASELKKLEQEIEDITPKRNIFQKIFKK